MNHIQMQQQQQESSSTTPQAPFLPTAVPHPQPELTALTEALAQFETMRQRPALLYMAEDQRPWPKTLDDGDALILYEALQTLRRQEPLEHLDLVINTAGGQVTSVRKLLHVLHTMVKHLTILVPYKAQSAGTILCLGAHELILTPIAELSPIDPQLQGTGTPGVIEGQYSSEDVALFRTMAQQWFGVKTEQDAFSLLRLYCDKMFPPALTHFFRAEQLVRQIALEALHLQNPDASATTHESIVEQLLSGYSDHNYPLNHTDLTCMGLPVALPSPEEEQMLWSLWQRSRTYMDAAQGPLGTDRIDGLLLSAQFVARHHVHATPALPTRNQSFSETMVAQFLVSRWERIER